MQNGEVVNRTIRLLTDEWWQCECDPVAQEISGWIAGPSRFTIRFCGMHQEQLDAAWFLEDRTLEQGQLGLFARLRLVRASVHCMNRWIRLERERSRLHAVLGRPPTADEQCLAMGIPRGSIERSPWEADPAQRKEPQPVSPKSAEPPNGRLRDEEFAKVVLHVRQSEAVFPGRLQGAVMGTKRGAVNFLDERDRADFAKALGKVLVRMRKAPDLVKGWALVLKSTPPTTDRFTAVALLVSQSLARLDVLARLELEHAGDERVQRLRAEFMAAVLGALERYYGEDGVVEITEMLPNVHRVLLGPLAD